MSNEKNTYRDYWDSVDSAATSAIEAVDNCGQDETEAVCEAADGTYWVIYTHAAALTMQYSDNSDAYWDAIGGESVPGDCWSMIVSLLAAYAYMEDVRDRYERMRKEKEVAPTGLAN